MKDIDGCQECFKAKAWSAVTKLERKMTADPTQLALLGQRFKKCLKLPLEKDGQPEPKHLRLRIFSNCLEI